MKRRKSAEGEKDATIRKKPKNYPSEESHERLGPHSVDLCHALKFAEELETVDWMAKSCADQRHACQEPMHPMRTILETSEGHRQTVMWKVLGSSDVIVDTIGFEKRYPSKESRAEALAGSVSHVLLRRVSVYEQLVFQGLDFLKFDPETAASKVHGLIGNSLPPRVAACFFAAMKNVQTLRTDRRIPGGPFGRVEKNFGWHNATMVELFAGLGGLSMGADYVDLWSPRFRACMESSQRSRGSFPNRRLVTFADGLDDETLARVVFSKPHAKEMTFLEEPLGFEHLLLVDFSERSVNALKSFVELNPGVAKWDAERVVLGDAGKVDLMRFRDRLGLICGGPPCQPFSMAGRRKGMSDERQGWRICARALLLTNAETFLFENVKSLCTGKMNKFLSEIKRMLSDPFSYFKGTPFDFVESDDSDEEESSNSESAPRPSRPPSLEGEKKKTETDADIAALVSADDYPYRWIVGWKIVNCSDFGVPQARERVFFYGYRVLSSTIVTLGDPFTRTEEFLQQMKFPDKRTAWEVMRESAERNDAALYEKMETGNVTLRKALGLHAASKDNEQCISPDQFALWRKLTVEKIPFVK